jgi:hypothetical protein
MLFRLKEFITETQQGRKPRKKPQKQVPGAAEARKRKRAEEQAEKRQREREQEAKWALKGMREEEWKPQPKIGNE